MKDEVDNIIQNDFEQLYIRLREKEGRIYSDEEVAALPDIAIEHQHYKEWQIRKDSSRKLISHLEKRNRVGNILEIGCGNGWLSHRLAALPGSHVIGADINFTELQQAAKVFSGIANLHFVYGQASPDLFEERQFDIIIFAASIQYFSPLPETIEDSLRLLKPGGEIHILDSHFYPLSELGAARQRSLLYYEAAGFPEMADWYFHHNLDELDSFNYSILYDPNSIFNRFIRNKNPFYWILLKH